MLKIIFFVLIVICLSLHATTLNWYFSKSIGNDTSGNGTIEKPWKTLSKMQNQIDSRGYNDTVNIFLKRGDTWNVNTISSVNSHYTFPATGPMVNLSAYGRGTARPAIDGGVINWETVPYDGSSAPAGGVIRRWNTVFRIERNNCSIKNIEIRNVYGNAITLRDTHYQTFTGNLIHNFGTCAIMTGYDKGGDNVTVAYNIFHTGQQLYKFEKRTGWEASVNLITRHSDGRPTQGHHVHHNIVYDIFGEGLNAPNSIIEWNLVGDTGSTKLNASPHKYDSLTSIIRYNLTVQRGTTPYNHLSGASYHSIRIFDEDVGGDNTNAYYQYYGNVFIRPNTGFWVHATPDCMIDNHWKRADIYNNLFIDSNTRSYMVFHPEFFDEANIYNNSSILIQSSGEHANTGGGKIPSLPHENWTIKNNHFWTKGENTPFVPSAWKNNWNTNDPQLLGQNTVNWIGLSGPNYWRAINPVKHLNPPSSSPIHNLNPVLTLDIDQFINIIENYHLENNVLKLLTPTNLTIK